MRAISAVAIGVLLACPGAALAQGSDAVVEGTGYRVGEGSVLRPTAGIESIYVSNTFYEAPDDTPRASGLLRIIGGLSIGSLPLDQLGDGPGQSAGSEPKLAYLAGIELAYEQYLSSIEQVKEQSNLSGTADLKLSLFPKGDVRFALEDSFTRHTRPVNFESSRTLDRDINDFRLRVAWHPRGRTLNGNLSYRNRIDRFESEASAFANRLQHTIGLQVNWQYLPVTRFYLRASQGFYGQLGDATLGGEQFKNSSMPLRVVVGGDSAITEATTVRTHAGFAAGFYDAGPSYTTAVYGVELGYRYSPLGRVVLKFDRDFEDSVNANYYGEYRFSAGLEHQVSRFFAGARGALALRSYEGVPLQLGGGESRSDVLVDLSADVRYYYREWLAVTAGYSSKIDETDYRTVLVSGTDDPSYVRHEVGLSVHAAY